MMDGGTGRDGITQPATRPRLLAFEDDTPEDDETAVQGGHRSARLQVPFPVERRDSV